MGGDAKGGGAAGKEDFRFSPRPNRAADIDWLPWGEEAFRRAGEEGKAVLLSISAVWCHWCHVMDETSYSDRAVINLINTGFVAVRVDSDRNPDINRRYNQGGWPTTAFLDERGTLLAGATYLPPETMRAALERISELYAGHETDIAAHEPDLFPAREAREPRLEMVEEAGAQLLRAWDRAHGGLGREPKFPQPDSLSLALDLYADQGNADYLLFARSTLEAMIRGNLLDKVEGGFFRYSTTRDWSIPHYEKMLADNAALVEVLLRAYALSGAEVFRRTARETADFIYRGLSDGASRLFGSQDADEAYYLLDAEGREGRVPPPVDRTVYTDLAARAAVSLLVEGTALDRPEHVSLARGALDFLWSQAYLPGEGMAHYHDGAGARRRGLLEDNVEAAAAYLAAFAFSGEETYLRRAETLLRHVVQTHWDARSHLFLDTAAANALPGLRPEAAEPGSQARAAEAMLLLHALGGGEEWRGRAGDLLSAAAGMAGAYGILSAPLAAALNLYLRGPLLVRIGGGDEEARRPFVAAALRSPRARTLPVLEPEAEGEAWSEVCTARACTLRTSDPAELARELGSTAATR